ncbi:MAG: DUF5916 domain-containing protein [Flavobacteriaceae bacterium]
MLKHSIFFIVSFFFISNLFGQHSNPTTINAYYCNEDIKLDGKLDEACWQNAIPIENFTQREQSEGTAPTEKTKIAVVYTKEKIYFGVWCYDNNPDKISAQKMSRDFSWGSDDNIEIMMSTFNDNRNGYLFVTNPNGALADVWIGDEGKDFNKNWNGVWDVAVERNEKGWFAEIVIPFSTLKFKNNDSNVWGINFERNIRRKKEQVLWQGWSRLYELEKISQGGKLTGLENIKQGKKIEILPYLLGGLEFTDVNNSSTGKVGGEINFNIGPTLKLGLTVNTDFAQVESDRRQINLSRFSLYFPEKRQFFLEGKNYYDMNVGRVDLFHSRRIGIEENNAVPVIGGVRFFGKIDKTNVGLMSIQTYAHDSISSTNYSVIKIKQDIFKQSTIGVIATQKYSNDHYNRVYGSDFTYSSSEIFGNKNLLIGGSFAVSDTKIFGSNENLNDNNLAYNIFLSYPNDVIEFDVGFTTVQTDFNPEMGFKRRGNYQMFNSELQFNPRFKKLPFFRNLIFKPLDIQYYINDQTKEVESVNYEWRPFGFVTKSGEFFEFNVQHLLDKPTEDFELIDDIIIPAGEYLDNRVEIQFESFRGRKFAGELKTSVGEFYTGSRQEVNIGTYFSLNKHFIMSADWQRNYIQLPENSFITDEIGGRIAYAYNPKLETSIYAQWNNENENLLVNYRINWIPKIGSFFYFVINQEYDTNSGFKLERTTILAKLIWRFEL